MGISRGTSAFGVIHKAVTDADDPSIKAAVKKIPGKFDASAIRGKLAPLKAAAVRAAVKR